MVPLQAKLASFPERGGAGKDADGKDAAGKGMGAKSPSAEHAHKPEGDV